MNDIVQIEGERGDKGVYLTRSIGQTRRVEWIHSRIIDGQQQAIAVRKVRHAIDATIVLILPVLRTNRDEYSGDTGVRLRHLHWH